MGTASTTEARRIVMAPEARSMPEAIGEGVATVDTCQELLGLA
jgi:hypothetical protein